MRLPDRAPSRLGAPVGLTLPVGAFGEGLSTAGPLEEDVHIGDVMALGTAIVPVS